MGGMTRRPPRLIRATSRLLALGLAISLVSLVSAETGKRPAAARGGSVATLDTSLAAAQPAARRVRRLSNGCRLTRRGVPRCGALLGGVHGANTSPAGFERRIGSRFGVRRTYFNASQIDSAMRTARADLRRGRLPWMSFKLPRSWQAMDTAWGAGWARSLARRLRRLPGPVWVAFHHEPENDGGDIMQWKRMQERLIPAVRKTAPNVAFTVVLMGWHQFYGDRQYRLSRMFPKKGHVDVVGFDIYNQLGVVKSGRRTTNNTPYPEYFRKISRFAKRRGIAWGMAETGYTNWAASRRPRWIRKTFGQLRRHGGVAFSYFNTTLHSIADWTLQKPSKRRDFARALRRAPKFPRW